jgi:hypothetical protein
MPFALISPSEPRETGFRVAEISSTEFEVADPFFWVSCDTTVAADQVWYDPSDQSFKEFPPPPEPVQPTTEGTQNL